MISNDKSRFLPTAYDRQSVTSYQEALNEIRENREQTNFDNINDIPRHRNNIQKYMIAASSPVTMTLIFQQFRLETFEPFLNINKPTG